MKNSNLLALLGVLTLVIASCSKEPGFGGENRISGIATYQNGLLASGAVVYLTFNVTEATETYDYATVCDSEGYYYFEGLERGDYFLDCLFTDENGFTFNTDGFYVMCGGKKSELEVNIELE